MKGCVFMKKVFSLLMVCMVAVSAFCFSLTKIKIQDYSSNSPSVVGSFWDWGGWWDDDE